MLHHFLRATRANSQDPYFKQVALLLHGDGTNGAQNNTFIDSSSNNFSITRNGNTTQGTFTPYSLAAGYWSNFFDGTGDFLTAPNNAAFDFGSGNFTIEGWISVSSNSPTQQGIYGKRANNGAFPPVVIYLQKVGSIYRLVYAGSFNGSSWGLNSSFTNGSIDIGLNTWVHVALVRNGSTFTSYVNGVADLTFTGLSSSLMTNTDAITIGADATSGNNPFNGAISNLRVVKGTAVYTSAFTPPTSPLTAISGTSLLTCQSNRFRDNSSNNFAITRNGDVRVTAFSPFAPTSAYSPSVNGGSGYFDGTGDYLSLTTSTNLDISTGDFTIEFYVNPSLVTTGVVFGLTDGSYIGSATQLTAAAYFSGSTLVFRVYSGSNIYTVASPAATTNQWTHYALVRSGNVFTVYANGTSAGTTTQAITLNYSGTWKWGIGSLVGDTQSGLITGYISNVRVVKGTAVYTANFTPPTAPLTAITNTSLLLNFTNAGIFDNAAKNDLETVGTAQISTSVKRYGTGSIFINGSGQYLTAPAQPQLAFGTGNFTIECWVNPTGSQQQYAGIYSSRNGTNPVLLCFSGSFSPVGATIDGWLTGGTVAASSTATITSGSWTHLAFVRNNGVCTIYVNGVAGSTTTTNNANIDSSLPNIGRDSFASSRYFTGYIDDLRITKGIARYTANFTPPQGPYPNQ